ncbi:hypothetical protein PF005_g11232 [Phytophthora fragariae]|uniref:Uncharacterized protein n=1 Tax=Phytophthora fragariae TaxID=53985 RepID=A0A6A3QLA6_9STRA|nr:hypothetical protein PF003_g14071 [Phytophthora fragariae]KAE8924784.1 hypothetical protein PF009_g24995 [Phytophthora fragariae]KAE8979450.1 hypothetical protein PF011_g22841 [Phytophthora fragariae]KAE9077409.1 hypothetical protein PF010_g23519 [Phytophthora fragariae]KAE9077518.1 hypothetical protein PF007_g24220 [Phytophthora fragariae]
MGQACSSIMARCCHSRRHPSVQNKEPLVVEDESWKCWSSYNLIHHPSATGLQAPQKYTPPTYVSSAQQPTEAVWEV